MPSPEDHKEPNSPATDAWSRMSRKEKKIFRKRQRRRYKQRTVRALRAQNGQQFTFGVPAKQVFAVAADFEIHPSPAQNGESPGACPPFNPAAEEEVLNTTDEMFEEKKEAPDDDPESDALEHVVKAELVGMAKQLNPELSAEELQERINCENVDDGIHAVLDMLTSLSIVIASGSTQQIESASVPDESAPAIPEAGDVINGSGGVTSFFGQMQNLAENFATQTVSLSRRLSLELHNLTAKDTEGSAPGMEIMKTRRQMMERAVSRIYELFQSDQIESLVNMMDKDARLDASAFCDYNPFQGMYDGRSAIRERFVDYKSAVELTQHRYQISEIDEVRGTVLVHVQAHGKFRSTGNAFAFSGWEMLTLRNGHIWRMKFWGGDREFAHASKTPAAVKAYNMAQCFFNNDMAGMRSLCGNAKMKFHSNGMDPKTGEWTVDQWMKMMQKYDFQYTSRGVLFDSKNHVILEYRCSHWCDNQTGQSLMGHRPELFRFLSHVICDDAGNIRECEMHMSPQPSGFLFAKPHGGASKLGLTQHV